MKKLLTVFVALALLAGSAFALPTVTVGAGGVASTSIFFATKSDGKANDGDDSISYGSYHNGSSYILGQKDGVGTGDDIRDNFSLKFTISGDNASAYVNFVTPGDPGVAKGVTIGNFLAVDGWAFKGNIGKFDGQFGTDGYGGQSGYSGGYFRALFENDKVEGNNLNKLRGTTNMDGGRGAGQGTGDFLLAIGFKPADMFKIAVGTRPAQNWNRDADGSTSGISLATIVSLIKVADLVSVDIYYGINGESNNTKYATAYPYNNGVNNNNWENLFGVYGALTLGDLGLKFGYTGGQKVYQSVTGADDDDATKTITKKVTSPLFNGIDLNVSYKVNDQVNVNFNNNISFASAVGAKNEYNNSVTHSGNNDYRFGGASWLGKDDKDSYFVYAGELGGTYKLSDSLSLGLTFTERLGTYDYSVKVLDVTTTYKTTKNQFDTVLKATYKIGPVTLESGLALRLLGFTGLRSSTASGAKDYTISRNVVTFNVPVTFRVGL